MRAAVYHGPHDVRIESVADPGPPAPGELLLRVARAAICGSDCGEYLHGPVLVPLRERHPGSGHVGPLVLGHELVGVVEAVGPDVEGFAPGDRVVTGAGVSCGRCDWCARGRTNLCERYYTIGLQAHGGLAERVAVPASTCLPVPDGCSDDAAALAQPFAVGIHAFTRAQTRPGDSVAVLGAGGIGMFVVAAAAAGEAGRVIAVDVDPARLEIARAVGATDVVDARATDAAEAVRALTYGAGAHAVVECTGIPSGPPTAIAATRRGGTVVIVGLQKAPVELDLLDLALREIDLRTSLAHVLAEDLGPALAQLAETDLAATVTDRVIALDELVPEGLEALAGGHVHGKIVVDPAR